MPAITIAEKIADFGLGLNFDGLSDVVVHEVKRRVIDSLGCALGAIDSPPVVAARAVAPRLGNGLARIIGTDILTAPEYAAFVNGVMVRYLDWNDTYLSLEPAHPSDNIPAALACAEVAGRTGREFITAVVAAYEVQCRLCDAATLRRRGFDHVCYGAFSATLAAAMLLGLSRDETVHALGIAGVSSVALRQTRAGELSMWKGAAFANTARNAVFAAELAKQGMTGPGPVFEGEFGFMRLVSGGFTLPVFGGGNVPFKITDTCIKYHPAEYHAQSAIEAAVQISKEIESDAGKIDSVRVCTFGAAYEIIGSGAERWRPATRETADHSLPFLVATALQGGGVTLASFDAERLRNALLLALMDKITVVRDAGLDALYPEAMPNRVEARMKTGEVIIREVIYPKGHPKNPLSDVEVEAKFRRLAAWRFSEAELSGVLSALWRLDEERDIRELLRLFSVTDKS